MISRGQEPHPNTGVPRITDTVQRVLIQNNVIEINRGEMGGDGYGLFFSSGVPTDADIYARDITVTYNTVVMRDGNGKAFISMGDHPYFSNGTVEVAYNLATAGNYGLFGTAANAIAGNGFSSVGAEAFQAYCGTGSQFHHNILIGLSAQRISKMPAGNTFLDSVSMVGFVNPDWTSRDFRLLGSSAYVSFGAKSATSPHALSLPTLDEQPLHSRWARIACGASTTYSTSSSRCELDRMSLVCTSPPPTAPAPAMPPVMTSPPPWGPVPIGAGSHPFATPTLPASFDAVLPASYASRAADVTLSDGNMQQLRDTLAAATPGQIIELQANVTWSGFFVLPNRGDVAVGDGAWVVIRSSAWAQLPSGRIGPEHAHLMPKLVAIDSRAVLKSEFRAHSFWLLGIEVTVPLDLAERHYGLVELGSHNGAYGWGDHDNKLTDLVDVVHHITLDRCYLHGHADLQVRVGVELNGAYQAVINSYLSDFHEAGADSQAINGWTGPGPLLVENNYLEGAGENIIFGGADPKVPELVPSDIIVRGNLFHKPLEWRWRTYPTKWVVKNLFELKNARRVLVDNNTFINNVCALCMS